MLCGRTLNERASSPFYLDDADQQFMVPKISRGASSLATNGLLSTLVTMSFPYSYFSCPCTSSSATTTASVGEVDDEAEEEKTFDPRSPRTNFSLYPLDHLLWCEDCHEIRCVRCTIEEIVCWYCPSCLFEVASSMVKSEGNR